MRLGATFEKVQSCVLMISCPREHFSPTTNCLINIGQNTQLSELQDDDPLILTALHAQPLLPKRSTEQHLKLAAFCPKIAVAYTRDRHDRRRRSPLLFSHSVRQSER